MTAASVWRWWSLMSQLSLRMTSKVIVYVEEEENWNEEMCAQKYFFGKKLGNIDVKLCYMKLECLCSMDKLHKIRGS